MEDVEELEAGEVSAKDEDEEDEAAILNALENALVATEEAEKKTGLDSTVGTADEQTFSRGMAATVNILRQQGLLAAPTADQLERERVQMQRDLWLADQRRRVAQRELDRLRARGAPKDQAQREYENRLREQAEARDAAETFKHYKPDVKIEYFDEHGRSLTPKEAWKALSHRFHGKGSGKMKTEKRLKKIADEKKKEAMASGDTPLSMSRAFQIRQEKTGQAHFVLSVGNRGYVSICCAMPASRSRVLQSRSPGCRIPRPPAPIQGQAGQGNERQEEGKLQGADPGARWRLHNAAGATDIISQHEREPRTGDGLTRAAPRLLTHFGRYGGGHVAVGQRHTCPSRAHEGCVRVRHEAKGGRGAKRNAASEGGEGVGSLFVATQNLLRYPLVHRCVVHVIDI
jgi:hypothetical protein